MTNIQPAKANATQSLMQRIAQQNIRQTVESVPIVQTKKDRLAAWKTSRKSMTRARVAQLKEVFAAIPTKFGSGHLEEPRLITAAEADGFMERWQYLDEAELAIKAEKAQIKSDVEAHVNTLNEHKDEPDTETGKLISPKFGKKFALEGGGRKAPTWDIELLRSILGDDFSKAVAVTHHPEVVIEAWDEEVVEESLLLNLVQSDFNLMEKLKPALILGDKVTRKLNVRALKDEDKAEEDL